MGSFKGSGRTLAPARAPFRRIIAAVSAADQLSGALSPGRRLPSGYQVEEVGIRPEQVFVLDRLPPIAGVRSTNPVSTRD